MKIIQKGNLYFTDKPLKFNCKIAIPFLKQSNKNIHIVATNERAITGNANVLCATKQFITAK